MGRIQTILDRIYTKTNYKHTLFFFLFFLVFTSVVLPYISNLTERVIGVSESIDTNFSFNLFTLYTIIDSYQEEGRRFYVLIRWTFDVVWPLIYTAMLLTGIAFFAKKIQCKFQYKILYVPLLAISFDYLENIFATFAMLYYPGKLDLVMYFLIASSMLKWGILSLAFLILILLIIRTIVKGKQNYEK